MELKIFYRVSLVCILLSFGLSLSFWSFWGVFQLFGFLLWSIVSAAAGVLKYTVLCKIGYRSVLCWSAALLATIIIRAAIFIFAVYL